MIGIYKIINIANGNVYIGSSKNIKRREHEHFSLLAKNRHGNIHLQHAFNLYGCKMFLFDVIEYCEENLLIEREQFWMNSYRTRGEILYNMCPVGGSRRGIKLSEEHKRKISKANKGKTYTRIYKPLSEERKKQMSIISSGRKHTEESKRKLSIANKGGPGWTGRKHSEESKEKIRLFNLGKKRSEELKQKVSDAQKKRWASGIYANRRPRKKKL